MIVPPEETTAPTGAGVAPRAATEANAEGVAVAVAAEGDAVALALPCTGVFGTSAVGDRGSTDVAREPLLLVRRVRCTVTADEGSLDTDGQTATTIGEPEKEKGHISAVCMYVCIWAL